MSCERTIGEFKHHVYGKRQIQVENFSIENEQIETAQNNFMDKKLREITNLGLEIKSNKRQVKRRLGHPVQIRVCRLT